MAIAVGWLGCASGAPPPRGARAPARVVTTWGYDAYFEASCPGGLPHVAPTDLEIQLAIDGSRWRLHAVERECSTDPRDALQPFGWSHPPPTCVARPDDALRATYDALRELRVDTIRTQRPEEPPRGTSFELRWLGGAEACCIGATTRAPAVHREDRERWRAALEVLWREIGREETARGP